MHISEHKQALTNKAIGALDKRAYQSIACPSAIKSADQGKDPYFGSKGHTLPVGEDSK